MQYIADNVDHNTITLDGHGTLHAMGVLIAAAEGVLAKSME